MHSWLELRRTKAVCLLLALLLFGVCIVSGLLALYMAEQWYYGPDTGDFYESGAAYRITWAKAEETAHLWQKALEQGAQGEGVYTDSGNFIYEILSAGPGSPVVAHNLSPQLGYREMGEFVFDEVWIRAYVRSPLEARDEYWDAARTFDKLYPHRWTAVLVLGAGFVLLVVDLCLLCAAAGRRRGVEGVVTGRLERVPLDLLLLSVLVVEFLLLSAVLDNLSGWWLGLWEYAAAGVLLLLGSVIGIATLLTLAVRYKAGGWWRGTLLYQVFRPVGEVVSQLYRSLPLIWRTLLVCAGIETFGFLLVILTVESHSFGPLILFCLLLTAIFLGAGYVSLGLQRLGIMGQRIAAGELDYRPDLRGMPLGFHRHAETLGRIGEGLSAAVARQVRSERLKTELITNVSHDIKTPLTSIVNYVDLLDRLELDGEAGEYVAVLGRQAARLKKLTEDLVEASKATTGNLEVRLSPTGLCELLNQALAEYTERLAARELEPVVQLPEEELYALADGRQLWRVMDNLLGNVCKYAQPGTRVYLVLSQESGQCSLAVKNISRERLNIDAEELLERFVRGDGARASQGSGLGLHIARSLVELQHGRLELTVDGDLFKVRVDLPKAPPPPAEQPQVPDWPELSGEGTAPQKEADAQ